MMRSDDELTPDERDALARLPREAVPPAGLEQATVAALTARGLLRRPRRRFDAVLALAASVLLFAGGLALGRFGGETAPAPPADGRQRFALFLYEGPEYDQPAPGGMDERVEEYVTWASTERTDGTVEGGEKLKDGDDVAIEPDGSSGAVPSPPGEPRLAGYFLIRAADRRTALEIARSCPHVRYGGRIVVREIEPT
ncbi:MAG TPA: hypothetical protein VM094_02780 [Gemmatimonadales bacterium]|nr:hypothetical protein [Gemmatimonadales bacterium]